MTRLRPVFHILGLFLIMLAASMLVPVAFGVAAGWPDLRPFWLSLVITGLAGVALWQALPAPASDLSPREGVLLTVLVWVAISGFGSLPFLFSGAFQTTTDAVFETVSGFTTTGSSILREIEVLTPAIQFWRHLIHWLGGMGIVLLGIAILPLIGAGGMALYRAEFSGAKSEKLKPRLAETALALWRIYVALSLALYFLLRIAGMDWYDALCHTFSAMGTGGFSTRNSSVESFNNPAIEWIITLFMLLAAINFTQHYRLWIGGQVRPFFKDPEVRGLLTILGSAGLVVTATLIAHGIAPFWDALRLAAFQVVSIGATCGFATADYEKWPPLTHVILFTLMFTGGCTGSTSGGWKTARLLLMGKLVRRQMRSATERHGVFAVRLGGQPIPESTIHGLLNLIYLSLGVLLAGILAVTASGVDLLTAITSVVTVMFGVGPGFGSVGPAENFGHLPALAKWALSACMIAGRLEFYTALVVFTRPFWRK